MLAMGIGVGGAGGATVTPGGVNTNVQFNNNGAFGGNSGLTYDGVRTLTLSGSGTGTAQLLVGQSNVELGFVRLFTVGGGSVDLQGSTTTANVFNVTGNTVATGFGTATNCSSSASPAVCGSAAAGSVVIAAAATTVTVNTTAVTANSQILLTRDDSLGTKLAVTCNTATVMGEMKVSARTGGTSFAITVQTAPATNPGCISYFLIN